MSTNQYHGLFSRAVSKILHRARQLVDSKKEDGFTALHLATLNNHQEVVEILVKEVKRIVLAISDAVVYIDVSMDSFFSDML